MWISSSNLYHIQSYNKDISLLKNLWRCQPGMGFRHGCEVFTIGDNFWIVPQRILIKLNLMYHLQISANSDIWVFSNLSCRISRFLETQMSDYLKIQISEFAKVRISENPKIQFYDYYSRIIQRRSRENDDFGASGGDSAKESSDIARWRRSESLGDWLVKARRIAF